MMENGRIKTAGVRKSSVRYFKVLISSVMYFSVRNHF